MISISVLICSLITLILLKIFLNVKFKDIKELKNRRVEKIEVLANKFQSDEKICKDILTILNNENVKIKSEPEYTSCLYTIFNNTITIGKFQQNYMKLQTIAHECIHSCQNKITLWGNFIITNIYLIYFAIVLILGILNKLPYADIHILIFAFASVIQYIIRNTLEIDAMTRAIYVAKEYIEKNKILNKEETKLLLQEYDKINKFIIPFANYNLIFSNSIKIIIISLFVLI